MAATSSNSTFEWPRIPCASGCGLCIPTKAGPGAKHPGRYYYKCPSNPPCKRWIGWCDEQIDNVVNSGDNRLRKSTGPNNSEDSTVDLHSLTERVVAIGKSCRVLIVVGIIICVLQLIHVICALNLSLKKKYWPDSRY